MSFANTTFDNLTNDDTTKYDDKGALVYILFTLFWYSLFVICLLFIQTKKTEMDYFEDSDDPQEVTAQTLFKSLRSEDSIKREALGNFNNKCQTFLI